MRKLLVTAVVAAALTATLSAQSEVEQLEQQLAGARGTERVELLNRLARATQGNAPRESLDHAAAALELAEQISDEEGRAKALNNLGIGHYFLAEYGRALNYYEESLEVAQALGLEERIADALNNIGILHYMWGEYDETLEYYSRALQIRREMGDKKRLASTLNNLGNVYDVTEAWEESLSYYAEALLLYEEIGDEQFAASTLNNIGLVYHELERHDEALRHFEQALEIEELIDDKSGLAFTLNNLGMAHGSLGRNRESLDYHQRSLAVRREIGDRQGEATCRHSIGRVYAAMGEFERSLEYLDQALGLAREINVKEIERDVHLALSETYEQMGLATRAIEHYKLYKQVNDSLFGESTAQRLGEWRARLDVERKDREIEALRSDQEIQRIVRNFILGGSVLLVVLIVLLYNRYRLKNLANLEMQKANEALKLAQIERDKAARAELAHVSRVAVMGELATALAHELNQPLTAILSNAQATKRIIASGRSTTEEVDEALGDIVEGAGRAREIIQRLRDLVRRGEITRESLNINGVLRGIEKIARADAEHRGVTLVLDLTPDLPPVSGDRIQLQQVVLNLVHNGAEVMEGQSGEDRRLVVTTRLDEADRVEVAVRDTGPGLDDAGIAEMFEPFFTTKPDGLGMGLPICASIIEMHRGRLWAERNPDRGLVVRFTLPRGTVPPSL